MAQTPPTVDAPMPKDAMGILQAALDANDIDVAGLKPWHLNVIFELTDAKGKPSGTETLDELWAGPKQQKRTWAGSVLNQVEIINADGAFRSGDKSNVPSTLQLARALIVHPMPPERDIQQSTPTVEKLTFSKIPMQCVMLSQPIPGTKKTPPLGLFPTYCFNADSPAYRIGYEYGDTSLTANKIGKFQGRYVAVQDNITTLGGESVSGTVGKLATIPSLDPAEFTPGPDATNVNLLALKVSSGVAAGNLVHKETPIYPESAKYNHIQGTVILKAIIGDDGHINSLHIVSSPDMDLAIAAIAGVRHWRYKPYTLNGVPTEVDTTITVNFSMN